MLLPPVCSLLAKGFVKSALMIGGRIMPRDIANIMVPKMVDPASTASATLAYPSVPTAMFAEFSS